MPKQRILIVDDEPLNIEFIESALSKDYEIIKASSGTEALKMLEKTLPVMILIDISMQNINGFALCRVIKSNHKTLSIPVIMITPLIDNDDRCRAYEAGVDDILNIPFNENELKEKVKSLIKEKKRYGFFSFSNINQMLRDLF